MSSSMMQTDVMARADTRRLIAEVFEETALVLGGLVAVCEVDDDFVWRFVKGLDAVCTKALKRIDHRGVSERARRGGCRVASATASRHRGIPSEVTEVVTRAERNPDRVQTALPPALAEGNGRRR